MYECGLQASKRTPVTKQRKPLLWVAKQPSAASLHRKAFCPSQHTHDSAAFLTCIACCVDVTQPFSCWAAFSVMVGGNDAVGWLPWRDDNTMCCLPTARCRINATSRWFMVFSAE